MQSTQPFKSIEVQNSVTDYINGFVLDPKKSEQILSLPSLSEVLSVKLVKSEIRLFVAVSNSNIQQRVLVKLLTDLEQFNGNRYSYLDTIVYGDYIYHVVWEVL